MIDSGWPATTTSENKIYTYLHTHNLQSLSVKIQVLVVFSARSMDWKDWIMNYLILLIVFPECKWARTSRLANQYRYVLKKKHYTTSYCIIIQTTHERMLSNRFYTRSLPMSPSTKTKKKIYHKRAHVRTKNVSMMCHTKLILLCQAIRNEKANLVTSFLVAETPRNKENPNSHSERIDSTETRPLFETIPVAKMKEQKLKLNV